MPRFVGIHSLCAAYKLRCGLYSTPEGPLSPLIVAHLRACCSDDGYRMPGGLPRVDQSRAERHLKARLPVRRHTQVRAKLDSFCSRYEAAIRSVFNGWPPLMDLQASCVWSWAHYWKALHTAAVLPKRMLTYVAIMCGLDIERLHASFCMLDRPVTTCRLAHRGSRPRMATTGTGISITLCQQQACRDTVAELLGMLFVRPKSIRNATAQVLVKDTRDRG